MRIKKICELCGVDYWTGNGKAKYCSDECRKEAARRRQVAWREEHPEYHKDYHREHPEAVQVFKERHPDYARDRWRKIRGNQEHVKQCVVCGKTFTTWRSNKLTCSDECKAEKERMRLRNMKKKRDPAKEHDRWIRSRYGSEEAYRKWIAEREKVREEHEKNKVEELEARRIHGVCVVCERMFETYNPNQKTCCSDCGKKLRYARKEKRIPKDQIVDKDITLGALYMRDSGVCYLCGEACDWNDKTDVCVGEKYPSIDHIIPVSRGGLHAWSNVRLAHFGCNLRKSNDLIPEAEKLIPLNAYSVKREPIDQRKRTIQLSKDGEIIAEYQSTAEAEKITGIKQRGIQKCARGETKTYYGFAWRYA